MIIWVDFIMICWELGFIIGLVCVFYDVIE